MRLRLNRRGILEGTRHIDSPNSDERPPGCAIELLVIHHISLPPSQFGGDAIEAFFTNRLDPDAHPFFATIAGLKASAHFLVRRDGEVLQFVPCDKRAWHAGESSWNGRPRCNDFSIGIEVEGDGDTPFTQAQYQRLAALTRVLIQRYPIADIVGHSDIAPSRKFDPGPQFDWSRYRAMIDVGGCRERKGQNKRPGALRNRAQARPPRARTGRKAARRRSTARKPKR